MAKKNQLPQPLESPEDREKKIREKKKEHVMRNKENLIMTERKKQSRIQKDITKIKERLPIEEDLWEELFNLVGDAAPDTGRGEMGEVTREDLIIGLSDLGNDACKMGRLIEDLLGNDSLFYKIEQFNR